MANQGVYQVRHIKSGRVYIGGTRDFDARWKDHRSQLRSGKHPAKRLLRDFWLCGLDGLVFEVLERVPPGGDLLAAEQAHLDARRPYDPAIGYNSHTQAQGPTGTIRTKAHRAKIAAALKGRPLTEDRKAKISAARMVSPRAKAAVTAHNATKRALTYEDAQEIRRLHATGVTAAELQRRYGVTRNPIRCILLGQTYTQP